MKHETIDPAQGFRDALAIEDVSARTDALLAILPPCSGLPSTATAIAAADAQARGDFAAGRVHSHDEVSSWMRSWGKSNVKPVHEWRT